MYPQISAFGTGHNNPHLDQPSQYSAASASSAAALNSFLLSVPIGTTGGNSGLNKILFKFYCILIWTYKKHNKENMYIMDCKPLPMLPYALLEEEKIPLKKKKKRPSALSGAESIRLRRTETTCTISHQCLSLRKEMFRRSVQIRIFYT